MKSTLFLRAVAPAIVLGLVCSGIGLAANSINVKIGYVFVSSVKQQVAQASTAEALRAQTDGFLQAELKAANDRMDEMKKQNKSSEEIDKVKHDLQLVINAKGEAYRNMVAMQESRDLQTIGAAAAAVASERGLDLVVDGGSILSGGEKLKDGEDITSEVVKRLQGTVRASSSAQPASAPAANRAAPK